MVRIPGGDVAVPCDEGPDREIRNVGAEKLGHFLQMAAL
jgi:hypothetical protein